MSALEVSMMKRIGELNAEIKLRKADLTDCKAESDRLKAEVERRTAQYNGIIDTQLKVIDDLKAEVERLRASSFVTAVPVEHYERLRKAGDAVVADLEHLTKSGWFDKCKSVKQWNIAKKYKPSV